MRIISVFSFILCCGLLVGTHSAQAETELTLAAGAGYKRLVEQLATAYEQKTGHRLQKVFGNMGQVIAQAKQSDHIDLLLGDKRFLDKTSLAYAKEIPIGQGQLLLAVAKGIPVVHLSDVKNQGISRVAMPDRKKAIYGYAASEYLKNSQLQSLIAEKLLMVGTVPQVSAYVVSGEVDAGFINKTEAIAIEPQVERLIPVPQALYSPIRIVAKQLAHCQHTAAVEAFTAFLQTATAQDIIHSQGL